MGPGLEECQIVLDVATVGYARCDHDLRITSVNRTAAGLLCATPADLEGKRLRDLPPVAGPIEEACRMVVSGKSPDQIEHYCEAQDRWYSVTVLPDPAGGVVIQAIEMTRRKHV